jgi:phage-related tail fiber protein
MPNTIRIKRRAAGGAAGAPSSLATAELAFNEQDNILYFGYGDNGSGGATSIPPVAGSGAFTTLATSQTISGAKDFSTVPTVSASLLSSDNSTKVATTQYVRAQNYLTGNQTITATGDVSGSGTTALTLTLATVNSNVGTFTKVTVDGKGRVTSATTLTAADIPTLTASKISDFDTQVRTSRLDQMASPTAAVAFNSQKITGLADPTNPQDAATKNYVDNLAMGLDVKASVRVATTANIATLAGGAPNTLDGVTLALNDRILVKDQTTASQNGLYVVSVLGSGANGTWTRATDFDTSAEVTAGAHTFVSEGSTWADSGWVLATNDPITLGTTALTWNQFSGSGAGITAGSGLTKTGSTLDVNVDNATVEISSNQLRIKTTYGGQSSIATVGTLTVGTWQASIIGLQYGGTGANLSAAADGTIFKKSGTALTAATAGTDYLNSDSTIFGGTF